MSKSDMTIRYEDLNFDEWITPIINRAPKEHSKDFLFLGIGDTKSALVNVGWFGFVIVLMKNVVF